MSTALSSITRWLRGLGPKPRVERRQSARAPFTESVVVRAAGGITFHGIGRDLSETGLGAIVYGDLNIGDSVVIYYTVRESAATKFVYRPACVRRRHGNAYGFEFQYAPSARA